MTSNKINILILKNRYFLLKSLILLLIILFANNIFAQNDSIFNDTSLVYKKDTTLINDSIYQQNDKIISLDELIRKNDSTSSDTIKKETNISPDAITDVIDYSSKDSMLFSMLDKKMYLYGVGELSSEDMKLNSAFVEISTDENYLFSKSVEDSSKTIKPLLTQGKEKFTVKSIKYNFKSKKALILDAKMTQDQGFHLHTTVGKKQTNGELHIKNGKFTTCDLDHPRFYIRLTKAKKIPDKHVISGPMYFVIADIPLYIIGLPFGLLPNPKKNTSGVLIPEYGEDVNRGFYLRRGGYYWAINEKLNATLTGEVYSKGSWGLTLNSEFKERYKYSGRMNLTYSKHKTGEEVLPNSVAINTFWIKSSYREDPKRHPNSNFNISIDYGSSKHTNLNAKNINQNANSQKSSNIAYSWSKPGSIFNFSANMGINLNTKTQLLNLNLPTLAFNIKKQFPFKNLGTGSNKWYQKIGYSLNVNARNTVTTTDTLFWREQTLYEMKNGLKYSIPINTSFKLFEFVNVSPSINYTGRIYAQYLQEKNIYYLNNDVPVSGITNDTITKINHPFDFSFSLPFSTKLYGIFNINKGRLQAIRHVMSPSISYNYRPDFSTDFWGFYGYNASDSISPYYSHTKGFIFGTPPTGKSGAIGFSLGNNFEMKLKNKNDTIDEPTKIKLLDNLSLSTSYNLAVDSMNLSNIRISGSTRLFNNFSARFGASFDPYIRNENGTRINTFEWTENKRIARFNNATISFSGSLKPNKGSKKGQRNNTSSETSDNIFYYYLNQDIPYTDFNIPWNLSMNYNFVINNNFDITSQKYVPKTTQTASLNGSFSLTENWKITASSRYDFSAKKFISANFSIHRDLHCWEMNFNVIPFGTWKSYTFRINIKSSVLKDLKYEKRKEVNRNSFY